MDIKRFNNPNYKNQIKAVRNYRRQPKINPETPMGKFLDFTGLNKLRNQIFIFILVAAVIYFSYFAKFLFIKDVQVQGASSEISESINQNFLDYKKSYLLHIFPQKNILFFSKERFKNYLLSNNLKVSTVEQVKTNLWNKLSVTIKPRFPKYVLNVGQNYYILNSDSTIGETIPEDQKGMYTLIKDSAEEQVNPGDKFLADQKWNFIDSVSQDISKKLILDIESYEIPGRASDQLIVYLKKGFKVYFSTSSDEKEYFQRLYTLWLQLTPEQQSKLGYFDLRFDKNAYSCFKTDPCNNQ